MDLGSVRTKPIFVKEKEAHIIFEKSVKAKEITNKSVPDRRVKIEPKRDDNVRKFLWIAAIIFGFILVVITIIFIILISVKCSGASSEGIFIAAVLINAIGLIFGLANVVGLFLFLKMGEGTSKPKETTQ
ncbi:uncharacterized protein [Haliotis cracherodii]|uniref:uncharacterized protein n=1 Tax=Haliotis cracherodii TaxID=6455 RepID=UPI0039EAC68E